MDYRKELTARWDLPARSAFMVESLSHNLHLFTFKQEVERELYNCIRGEVPSSMQGTTMKRLMNTLPFKDFMDKRYEIYIRCTYKGERLGLTDKYTGNDEIDEEIIIKTLQEYYNYYPHREEALNKYEEKVAQVKEDPDRYCSHSCCAKPLIIRVSLQDNAIGRVIECEYIKIDDKHKI